jgi:hypothetical protein
MDRGVSAREDHREEGVVDEEIIDPSCEDDRVGINSGDATGESVAVYLWLEILLVRDVVVGAPSPRDSAVAIVVVLELPGEPASPAPPFAAIESFSFPPPVPHLLGSCVSLSWEPRDVLT